VNFVWERLADGVFRCVDHCAAGRHEHRGIHLQAARLVAEASVTNFKLRM
jgi:hypothetical protein